MRWSSGWLQGLLGALLAFAAGPGHPADFRSIGDRPAVAYDAPSAKANKTAILGRGQPVEIVVKLDKWTKVREVGGELVWLELAALTDRRTVVVTAGVAEIRSQPKPFAPLAFEAQRLVVLEVTGVPVDGWLPVRHRDGQRGFVLASQVWGA